MRTPQFSRNALEYGLLAPAISLAAVTAFHNQQFALAAFCFIATFVWAQRLGQLATAQARCRTSRGDRVR